MAAEQQAAAATEEQVKNCGSCGKPVKRITRYYRNGKFYCNKRCWTKTKEQAKAGQPEK
ncbi:MAG: hypothetical protein PHR11_06365 [Candidatus Omnitrophica bacterium]|nr:hypothetical protein [Candidatus Omnitrophota bacterium]